VLAGARAVEPPTPAEILRDLRGFAQMGSVLYIAAHPDDENTQLITYLARGRNYRTAYLSVTRGDGGQNVLGPEFDEELGVIRTQELLAARRLDGGRQFFTRAIDFGFSKDYRETLTIWDRQQVLSDMVRIIRSFQPDVMIARFSPQPGNNHGHHTASAVLAIEAFKLAGDTSAFPEQLRELPAWQPKRLLQNGRGFGRGGNAGANDVNLSMETGGADPVTGESFGDIAGRSRSMHKTQGFGNFSGGGRGGRQETFDLLGGQAATNDILDGVDTTWARVPGGEGIGRMADKVIAGFDTNSPAGSVPALLELRARLAALTLTRSRDASTTSGTSGTSLLLKEKSRQLDRILQGCLGLSVETTVPQAEVVPGETLKMRHTALVRAAVPVKWLGVLYPGVSTQPKKTLELTPNQPVVREASETLPVDTPLSQPYWLRQERTTGMFRVEDPALIGRPENPPAFHLEQVFEVGGQTLGIPDEPIQAAADATKQPRRLDVVAPVALRFVPEVELFAPGATRPVEVEVTAVRAGISGTLQLQTPTGWSAAPESKQFHLSDVGEKARLAFNVTAPRQAARARIEASALVNGVKFVSQRIEIRYPHIPPQLLQPPARLEAISLDLATRGHEVGYVPGAGDRTAEALEQMGYKVRVLTGADLTAEGLRGLDAVVIGIRAFNVRNDLVPHLPALFAFVEQGGTVVEQYNRPNDSRTSKLAPFDLRLSNERVTDETAPMTFLVPDHPALNTPNKITSADFEGWVQERGVYFPSQWDEHFTPLLACNDPGESPLMGSLLVTQYGRGYFVYTGLAMFRQLPAGVPGAYRLFANLVSLGHNTTSPPAQGAK
jgi:LmbE family N-acetylglucosaminyl deacetylase